MEFGHLDSLRSEFRRAFGSEPEVASRAPGRVNLIGEHTDYNDGWVLPAAITFEVDAVARPRDDQFVRIYAVDLGRQAQFDLRDDRPSQELWLRYPQGMAVMLRKAGHEVRGIDIAYKGDVPRGSGLSSSAAVEVALGILYARTSGLEVSNPEIAAIAHDTENVFVGVPTGVMDQYISANGKADNALLLDCRSLEFTQIPINLPGVSIVIVNTNVHRELAGSEYSNRRADCESAVEKLRARLPHIRTLRDVTTYDLEANHDLVSETELKRARHVVMENERTLQAAKALEAGDARQVGKLMYESHASLRDLYQVSSPELDAVVEIAQSIDGVIGARMTGAGFGGCAVSLVENEAVDAIEAAIGREYPARVGGKAEVYVCRAVDGGTTRSLI